MVKFVATSDFIRVKMVSADPLKQGTLTLFDGQFNQIMCKRHFSVEVSSASLVVDSVYYLSYEGNRDFSLEVITEYNNNWPQGALEVPHEVSWSSGTGDPSYSTVNSTMEGTTSSCTGGVANRWFKFIATSPYVYVEMTNDDQTKQATIALFDDRFNQITCDRHFTVDIEDSNLTVGKTYYLSYEGNRSFSLVVSGGSSNLWVLADSVIRPKDLANPVAIGTDMVPENYALAVNGRAMVEEVNVRLEVNWPDYVFEPDYRLPTLREVQNHIKANKHLPEIPSAQEIENEGVNLGEMNVLLLKKIEELTLYLIKQNSQLEYQQMKIEEQRHRVKDLESAIEEYR